MGSAPSFTLSNIEPGNISIYPNKDLLWTATMLGLGLIGIAVIMILYLGPAGIVLGFFMALLGLGCTILALKPMLNPKPTFILTDEYITKIIHSDPPEYLEILYSDISTVDKAESLFGNKLPYDVALRVNNIEKYSNKSWGNDLLSSISSSDIVIHLKGQDFEADALVQLLSKKIKQPDIPILELFTGGEYVANSVPQWKRLLNIAISVFIIAYVGYGLAVDKLLIPVKRGSLELRGFSAWVMGASAFFLVANLITVVIDHYDQRDNEKIYKKYRSLFYRCGYALFCAALITSLLQHQRDYKCKNVIVEEIEIKEKGKKIILYNRYCAEIEPMKNDRPTTLIALSENGKEIIEGDFGNIIARMPGCIVHSISWSQERLKVQYSYDKQYPQHKRGAYIDRKSPLSVDLVKVLAP